MDDKDFFWEACGAHAFPKVGAQRSRGVSEQQLDTTSGVGWCNGGRITTAFDGPAFG